MDMRRSAILAILFISTGCLANKGLSTESAAQKNVYHLSQICIGMTQEEVFQIMSYPQIDEQVVHEQVCYDVWFYITRTTALGQSELLPRNLTPLIFKDSILVAKGYDYYNRLFEEAPAPSGRHKPARDLEDIQIEKALRGRQQQQQQMQKQTPPQLPQEKEVPASQQPMQKQTPPQLPEEKEQKPPGAAPLQPLPAKPQQPSPPAQPRAPNRESAMSSKPNPSPSNEKSKSAKKPAPPKDNSENETQEKDFEWNEKDQRMIEQGDEQNFDYW